MRSAPPPPPSRSRPSVGPPPPVWAAPAPPSPPPLPVAKPTLPVLPEVVTPREDFLRLVAMIAHHYAVDEPPPGDTEEERRLAATNVVASTILSLLDGNLRRPLPKFGLDLPTIGPGTESMYDDWPKYCDPTVDWRHPWRKP